MAILTKFCLVLALCVLSLYAVRRLQTAGYLPQRGYAKIIVSWYYLCVAASAVVALCLWIFKQWWTDILVAVICLAVGLIFWLKANKPPLKFTTRIIRLVVVIAVVNAICVWLLPSWIVVVVTPLCVIVAWCITLPYELAMYCHYIHKAQRTIKLLKQKGLTVIAITGSYAKTSVKHILAQLLPNSTATPDSYNTPMGICKFVNGGGIHTHSQYFVAEIGARKKGDVVRLCKLLQPDYGILTGIAEQHLSTFKNLDNIKKEKSQLLNYVGSCGTVVLNGCDSNVLSVATVGNCKRLIVGEVSFGYKVKSISIDGTQIELWDKDDKYNFVIPLLGQAHANNVTMALAMIKVLGQNLPLAVERAERLKQLPHRMSVIHNGNIAIIDDGYNANIRGVERCCETLEYLPEFKIAIAQGIVEGGKKCKELNVKVGNMLGRVCDVVIALGINKDSIVEGAKVNANCKIYIANSLTQAVTIASQYYMQPVVVLFQNDIPN